MVTLGLFQSDPPSGGTLSGRYRRNGYVLGMTVSTVMPSSQASQLPHLNQVRQKDRRRLSGRHGSKLPRHRTSVDPKLCRYLWPSRASPLPQGICSWH
ncbi:hypothetical protein METHPM2_2270005 [Pseudomonas sp. PM2]